MLRLLFSVGLLAIPSNLIAQSAENPSDSVPTQGHVIVVVGAGGTDEYAEQFQRWATTWQQAASASDMTFTAVGLRPLAERQAASDGSDGESQTQSDTEKTGETEETSTADKTQSQIDKIRLKQHLEEAEADTVAPLWLVMIGHGTFARNVAKFNLAGPDVSATELANWLQRFQRPVVVVNTASSSGPFVNRLSSPGRVIVTATRSGTEQNFARFGRYFAEAIASTDSDLDHDDEVSVQEAFLRASNQVKAFYESQGRLATEHALIEDNADGKGTPATMFRGTRPIAKAKDGAELDGAVAAKITLAPSGSRLPFTEEERMKRDQLETELESIRIKKDELSQQEFDAAIEPILIELARLYQTVEARSQQSPSQAP